MAIVNDYPVAVDLLRSRKIATEILPTLSDRSGWEARLIRRHGITVWINDRHDTDSAHATAVKQAGARLVTFDDRGSGAALADLHIAALCFEGSEQLAGGKIVTGTRYLILNPEIERLRRVRTERRKILVTLGGTDTYGVTVKVVEILRRLGSPATVVVGPGFQHLPQLYAAATAEFEVKQDVPSLIEEFARHDAAITGGGMTAFEAGACGLPCVIIANEWFEVPMARHLERIGCALFAGHHSEIGTQPLPSIENVEAMSRAGIAGIPTSGVENVYRKLVAL